jgi:hypothetical protein
VPCEGTLKGRLVPSDEALELPLTALDHERGELTYAEGLAPAMDADKEAQRGDYILTGSSFSDGRRSLSGKQSHRFILFHFHFHFPAKKSVQKGEVGSDPRAGYFFNEVPCPPALRFTISWRTGGL